MEDEIGMFPRPCTGRLLTVPGANGPVASIEADFTTDKVRFENATRFLEPVNWKRCMGSFWCEMGEVADNSLPKGQRRYNESVSTHCGEPNQPGFSAQTELVFEFMWVPDKKHPQAAVANFELAPGRPLPNDRILVDEGTLVVSKVKQHSLRIITTKRVQFSHPFLTDQVGLIMCALGYADVTAGLLACASSSRGSPSRAARTSPGHRRPRCSRRREGASRRAVRTVALRRAPARRSTTPWTSGPGRCATP